MVSLRGQGSCCLFMISTTLQPIAYSVKCRSCLFFNSSELRIYRGTDNTKSLPMMKKTLFLESNKSRILVRRDSKRCFFSYSFPLFCKVKSSLHYQHDSVPSSLPSYSRGASYWCSYSLPSRQFPGKNVCVSR